MVGYFFSKINDDQGCSGFKLRQLGPRFLFFLSKLRVKKKWEIQVEICFRNVSLSDESLGCFVVLFGHWLASFIEHLKCIGHQ